MIINQVVAGSGGGGGPAHYVEKAVDANGKLVGGSSVIDVTGATDIGNYVLYNAYYMGTNLSGTFGSSTLTQVSGQMAMYQCFMGCTGLTGVNLCNVTLVGNQSMQGCFKNCTGITNLDISSLSSIGGYGMNEAFSGCTGLTGEMDLHSLIILNSSYGLNKAFNSCSGLTSVNLDNLTTINGQYAAASAFYGCSGLTNIKLSSLTIANNNYCCQGMFFNCAGLTTATLSSLTDIAATKTLQNMFYGCTNLATLSFPSLTPNSFGARTDQFVDMLKNVTGCTVHFPSNIQSTIGSWTDVTNGFSGTNTTVLFDLPATVTLTGADSVTYTRNPKYDTATALAWKVGAYGTTNFTPAYYTSGTTDPSVSDAIYSDAACTQALTTVASVA